MSINVSAFIDSLVYMIEGWLGIFIVMGVIIAAIHGLNKMTMELERRAEEKKQNS